MSRGKVFFLSLGNVFFPLFGKDYFLAYGRGNLPRNVTGKVSR